MHITCLPDRSDKCRMPQCSMASFNQDSRKPILAFLIIKSSQRFELDFGANLPPISKLPTKWEQIDFVHKLLSLQMEHGECNLP